MIRSLLRNAVPFLTGAVLACVIIGIMYRGNAKCYNKPSESPGTETERIAKLIQIRQILPIAATRHPFGATKHPMTATKRPITTTRHPITTTKHPILQDDILQNVTKPYYKILPNNGSKVNWTYFQLQPNIVTTVPNNYSISGKNLCSPVSPRVLFLVPSVVSDSVAEERLEIRKTWASSMYSPGWTQTSPTRLAFFFGSSGLPPGKLEALKKESEKYGDIVVGDFVDSYYNLTIKMVSAITWVAKYCPLIKTVVKIDMDVFVNVKLLLSLIDQLPSQANPAYVFGRRHLLKNPPVLRYSRWGVSKSLYPQDFFPSYVFGHSYVVSEPAVKLMSESFPYIPLVPNEDTFLTGIIPATLNITRFAHESFAYSKLRRSYCSMTRGFIVSEVLLSQHRTPMWKAFKARYCSDLQDALDLIQSKFIRL